MNHHQFFNEILPHVTGGPTRMKSQWSAHCPCPGAELHTTPTAPNHTTAYWNGGKPWINCHHDSCRDVVLAANSAVRSLSYCSGGSSLRTNPNPPRPKPGPCQRLADTARANKTAILKQYRWPVCQIEQGSPYPADDLPAVQTVLHLSLFDPDDVIWIGERYHSGKRWGKKFQPRDYWLPQVKTLSPLICPSVFRPGSCSRCDRNVVRRRFLVVESDTLTKDEVGAIFRFLSQELTLRAVVDTGGKSLHAWFDAPSAGDLAELKAFLTPLGCDPKMFGASQPSRLAGRFRDNGNLQRLVYVNPEVAHAI